MVNLRTFDLNLLRVFEAISHDRSVSIAADKLGLSQPAISNALNRLRRQLDDPLFIRTQHGMEPTPKAEDLARFIHEGLSTLRAGLTVNATFDPATSDRRFNLLMTDVGEISFLPVLLSTLNRCAPHIDIKVIEHGLQGYEDLLDNGTADLAIGRIKLPDSFESELIHSSPFVVIASRRNRYLSIDERGEPTISFTQYLKAPHIESLPRGASGDPIRQALGELWSQRRIALSIPHSTALPMVMSDTDLLATVPKVYADKLVAMSDLVALRVPFPIEQNFVFQWWHKRNTNDAGHRWLRQIFATAGV